MEYTSERIESFRKALHVEPGVIMVNSGSWGAISKEVLHSAVDELYKETCRRPIGRTMGHWLRMMDEYRAEVGRFLNCDSDEVAVCESTTSGLNICLWGYDFQPGDEIITGNLENPAMYGPVDTLAQRRGVIVKYADLGKWGEKDSVEAVREQITDKTKMVIISHVSYLTGAAVDAKGISALCREKGILTVFDGVQAVGTMPVDVRDMGCDAYTAATHKFLSGLDGCGFMYVSREAQKVIHPTFYGCLSDRLHGNFGSNPWDSAAKYDVSTRPFYMQTSATAALRYFMDEAGNEAACARIWRLRSKLYDLLTAIEGVEVLSIRENSHKAALMLFNIRGWEGKELFKWLCARKVYCREASHWYPPQFEEKVSGVRVSVNYWNTEEDMEAMAALVREAASMV